MEVPVFNKERAKLNSFNEVYLEAPKKATKVQEIRRQNKSM